PGPGYPAALGHSRAAHRRRLRRGRRSAAALRPLPPGAGRRRGLRGGLRSRRRLDARRPEPGGGERTALCEEGIATISISYRLAPAHRFPAPLDDVRRGLRWVRAHADELGIDPARIALLGVSAGAHLAVLAHLARDVAPLAPDLPPDLRDVSESVLAVIAHYRPYHLAPP